MPIVNRIAEFEAELIEWRHQLHKFPELGFEEHQTAEFIAEKLNQMGLDVNRGLAGTGVVATLTVGSGNGPKIGLRADMDALPILERSDFEHASKNPGVMHACGHDGHTTMLLGAAKYLAETKNFDGTVQFIFQPAEEGPPEDEGGGAKMMLEEGIFERYKPEVIFGLHVTNIPNGVLLVKSGPAMAAASSYRIKIKGVQAHGSTPWAGIDPIMATSQLIESLNTVVSRRINIINNPAVVSVGMIKTGTRANIIPEDSMLMGTIRTFDPKLRKEVYEEIEQIAAGVAVGTGTEITVEFDVGGFYPVTVNNPDLVEKMKGSLMEASPGKFYESQIPVTGAEDFSYFSQEIPGLYFWLGVNRPGEGESANFGERTDVPGNHSPYFIVDDSALDLSLIHI